MSRRKVKPIPPQQPRIVVEDRSQERPTMRLSRAMEILQVYDFENFMRIVELAEGYAKLYGNPSDQEIEAEFQARLARIRPGQAPEGN